MGDAHFETELDKIVFNISLSLLLFHNNNSIANTLYYQINSIIFISISKKFVQSIFVKYRYLTGNTRNIGKIVSIYSNRRKLNQTIVNDMILFYAHRYANIVYQE